MCLRSDMANDPLPTVTLEVVLANDYPTTIAGSNETTPVNGWLVRCSEAPSKTTRDYAPTREKIDWPEAVRIINESCLAHQHRAPTT